MINEAWNSLSTDEERGESGNEEGEQPVMYNSKGAYVRAYSRVRARVFETHGATSNERVFLQTNLIINIHALNTHKSHQPNPFYTHT